LTNKLLPPPPPTLSLSLSSLAMAGECRGGDDGGGLNQPLLEEMEANNHSVKEGNTGFFKTVFNGLNAITGVYLFLPLSFPFSFSLPRSLSA